MMIMMALDVEKVMRSSLTPHCWPSDVEAARRKRTENETGKLENELEAGPLVYHHVGS
jgi:hypothetical protein